MSYSRIRCERMALAKQKGRHSKQEWAEMLEFFEHTCAKCYGASGLKYVEKDHIIPIYLGGSDSIKNLQPLCARCNCSKGSDSTDLRIELANYLNKIMPSKWIN